MRWLQFPLAERELAVSVVLAALLVARPVGAQVCEMADTVSACYARVNASFIPNDKQDSELSSELRAEVVSANSGPVELPQGPAAAVTDFNPLLQFAADSGGLDESGESITISVNNFIRLPIPDYQMKLVVRNATLNDSLATALRDASLDDRVTELENELDDFDDVTLSFSYNPMREGKSRDPKDYQEWLSGAFRTTRSRLEAGATATLVDASTAYALLSGQVDAALPGGPGVFSEDSTTFQEIEDKLGGGQGFALMAAAEAMERARSVRGEVLRAALNEAHFFRFAELIDNQPQLYVSAEVNDPGDYVGPRSVGAKLTWEKGWVNMNSYQAMCDIANALECLAAYLNSDGNSDALERGDRIALSIEYKKIESYEVALIEDGISLTAPRDEMLVGSFTYGRYLPARRLGSGKPRVDFAVSYEFVDDSLIREDRLIATATFSQKLGDTSILSFGVVYANKPEFIGEVDKEISARVGINYKLGEPE